MTILFSARGRDVHIDVPLSNVALDYKPQGRIADMIYPIVTVPNQSDLLPVFSRGEILRIEEDRRAPGTEANKVSRSVSSLSFFCDNYALKKAVNAETRANADPIYRQKLYNDAGEYVTSKLCLGWERRVSLQVGSTSNVGSSAAVASGWTDFTNSDPLGDMYTALDNVHDATGTRPNNVTFGQAAWRNFRRNTNVLNKIFGVNNGGANASTEQVAQLLEVDKVHIGASYVNTANEGQAESLTAMWIDNVLCYYVPPAPSIDLPSFAYTFRWAPEGIPSMQAERHPYNTLTKCEEVEVGMYQVERITDSSLGFLLTAVNSST